MGRFKRHSPKGMGVINGQLMSFKDMANMAGITYQAATNRFLYLERIGRCDISLDDLFSHKQQDFDNSYCTVPESGCWLWVRAQTPDGYGAFREGKRKVLAHRHSLERIGINVPADSFVCHKCDTPSCVNPDHLYVGDARTNSADKVKRGRCRAGKWERNGSAKLTADQVKKILADNRVQHVIARDFGITQTHVSEIKNGKYWRGIA